MNATLLQTRQVGDVCTLVGLIVAVDQGRVADCFVGMLGVVDGWFEEEC